MAADINLLPENLRSRERDERKSAPLEHNQGVKFSSPGSAPVHDSANEPQLPTRWSRLVAAIKANLNKPGTPTTEVPHEQIKKVVASVPQPSGSFTIHETKGGATEVPRQPAKEPLAVANTMPVRAANVEKMEVSAPLLQTKPQLVAKQSAPPAPIPVSVRAKSPEKLQAKGTIVPGAVSVPPSALIDVNLIPAHDRQATQPKLLFMVGGAVVVGLIVVAGGYFVLQQKVTQHAQDVTAAQEEVDQLQDKLEGVRAKTETAESTKRQLAAVASLLDDRPSWLPLFTALEEVTIPKVYFSSVAADANGVLTLSGQGPSYTEVARQLKAFQDSPLVESVDMTGFKGDRGEAGKVNVGFSMVVKFKASVFSGTTQ